MTNKRMHIGICVGAALVVFATGCDSSGKTASSDSGTTTTTTATTVAASDSEYCQITRKWTVHEFVPFDDSSVPATKKYFTEWGDSVTSRVKTVPPEIRADVDLYSTTVLDKVIPIMAKYGYSIERLMKEGTEAETTFFDHPPADVDRAQTRIHDYEREVCGNSEPLAADVKFDGPAPAAYCKTAKESQAAVEAAGANGLTPDDVRALVTSEDWDRRSQAAIASAPPEIKGDVATQVQFDDDQQIPLFAKYGYDMRKILLEGTPHEREVLNHLVPEVRTAFARVLAYEEQLCGIGSDDE